MKKIKLPLLPGLIPLIGFSLFLSGCWPHPFDRGEVIGKEAREVYSSPRWSDPVTSSQRYAQIIVVGTNDHLGQMDFHLEKAPTSEDAQSQSHRVGGLAVLARYFEILRRKYPGQTLFLDAGNIYKGTLVSDHDQGESMAKLYNKLGYDAITIGHSDFEFGPIDSKRNVADLHDDPQGQLKRNIVLHKAPYVISNIIDLKTSRLIDWANTRPYIIKEVSGVKVAVIGGISSFAWRSIRTKNLRNLYIKDLSKSLIKYAHHARKKGAEIVVALLHAGGSCGRHFMKKHRVSRYEVNFNPKGKGFCHSENEVFQIINNMPPGTVNGIVAGYSKSKIANFYKGIPIIQSFSGGRFIGRMELIYDRLEKRIDLKKTKIYQPTKLCHQFFDSTSDCYSGKRTAHPKQLIPASFLGESIYPLDSISKTVDEYKKRVMKDSQKMVIQLDKNLRRQLLTPSTLSYIVSYSIRKATNAQVGLADQIAAVPKNRQGSHITFQDIYEILPRKEYLSKIVISGKELKLLVEIATSGDGPVKGQFSGIKIVLHNEVLENRDLNGDGKKEPWERKRLKSIRLNDGSQIEDDKMYTLGTLTFFSDNNIGYYDFVFDRISDDRKTIFYDQTNRRALLNLFQYFSIDKKALKEILNRERGRSIII
ncbi:MAG: 5'-nucleotidase C-terminal domain-containing protein [Bacteriovoracales bacterium]|nr:5'-nucleotidase C-terminal domain-containing protein [Bacteriovoracales bacterium]